MKIKKTLLAVALSSGFISAASVHAKEFGWTWDDQTAGAAGWSSTASYTYYSSIAWFGGWTTVQRPDYNLYKYNDINGGYLNHYYPADSCGYWNPCNSQIQAGNGKSFTFSSGAFTGSAGVKYVSFNLTSQSASELNSISVSGRAVNMLFTKKETANPGWTRITAPVGQMISEGGKLDISLGFNARQTNVSLDNVSATAIINPTLVRVNVDGITYSVPIGYQNFTGALDANGNSIAVTADVAGKLLATSQALGDLQSFNPNLKTSAQELLNAAHVNIGISAVRDSLAAAAVTLVNEAIDPTTDPLEKVDSLASMYVNAIGILEEYQSNSSVLAIATANLEVINNGSANILNFRDKVSAALTNQSVIDLKDIQAARDDLRLVNGAAHVTQQLVGLATSNSSIYVFITNTGTQILQDAASDLMPGASTLLQSGYNQIDQLESISVKDEVAKIIANNAYSEIKSPLDPSLTNEYASIAASNGYTNTSVYNPLSGVVMPNLQNAILSGKATDIPNERRFDISVAPQTSFFIDPIVATGFEYTVDEGPNIYSVVLPVGFGDGIYRLWLYDQSTQSFVDGLTDIFGGQEYIFGSLGIDRFQIRDIETSASLDPYNHSSFIAEMKFVNYGEVVMRVNPLTEDVALSPVPEPEAYAMLLAGLGLLSFTAKRRKQSA